MPDQQFISPNATSMESVVAGLNGKPMDTRTLQKGSLIAMKNSDETESELKEEKNKLLSQKPPTPDQEPKIEDFKTDPMQTFGSLGSMLAIFGSALTRHPLTSALNASASVFKAKNAGDYQAYKDAMDKWKLHTDNAFKQADWEASHLKAIQDNTKESAAVKRQKTELFYDAMQDPTGKAHSQALQDNLHQAQYNETVANAKEKAKSVKAFDLNMTKNMKKMQDEEESKTGKRPSDDEVFGAAYDMTLGERKSAEKATGVNDVASVERYEKEKLKPSFKKDAQSWNNGLPISQFIRGRGKEGEQYLQDVKDYAAELDPNAVRDTAVEDYNAASKAVSGFGDGKHGDMVRSFNVAYNHSDLVGDLADALGNGNVQRINALSQSYEQEFGSPAPTNFDAAKHILADEINKAAIGGAGALADRQALTANILRASSPEQIHGQLDTYKSLIIGQMKGIKQQYEQSTKRKDFDRLLSPEVADDLKKHEGTGSAEKPYSLPKDGNYKKDKYYINDDGQVGKYVGEKNGQHIFE